MKQPALNDTIAAISTSAGDAGIGLVRMSGNKSLSIADKVFLSKDGVRPSAYKTYTLHYGWIVVKEKVTPRLRSGQENKKEKVTSAEGVIDEVLLSVMKAPRSYTREDVVEISCHGGAVAVRRILELLLACGARMAEPGEFTQRAFLNGRIDLTQAEAVIDIIRAQGDYALRLGVEQLRGRLSRLLAALRGRVTGLLVRLEAAIDFEEDVESPRESELERGLAGIKNDIDGLLTRGEFGARLRDGVCAVICGRTNVGKSSLFNALLKYERSIVTPVPGTTRDTVEEVLTMRGIPVRLIDSAGVQKARGVIDTHALRHTQRSLRDADIIVLVFDGSRALGAHERKLIRRLKGRPVIPVINKCDLRQKIERDVIEGAFGAALQISARKEKNLNLLEEAFLHLVYLGNAQKPESVIAVNQRQAELLRSCAKHIELARISLRRRLSAEFVALDLAQAAVCLDRVRGQQYDSDVLGEIFSRFCIGK